MTPRFPCVTPVVERFSSELLRAIITYWAESHLKSCQTSTMELPEDVKQGSKCASDWKAAVNVGCRWTASAWNL